MANLTKVKIFPSIGVTRLGNSPEWFLGPELPFPAPPPAPPNGKYKDSQCRIKRQAQIFRLFGFFDDNSVKELTAADGTITWTVHVANAKPQPSEGTIIDPGPRTLVGPGQIATFANGKYEFGGKSTEVPLGEAHTDNAGHLIVVAGFGTSASLDNAGISGFDSPSWYDDVCDGPVNATIVVGGTPFNAAGAWVLSAPPHYAPRIHSVTSLHDVIRQVAINAGQLPDADAAGFTPSFVNDIWAILQRARDARRVAASVFGTTTHDTLDSVVPPGPGQDSTRQNIFARLTNPAGGGSNMPLILTGGGDVPATLRTFQYKLMQRWKDGDFVNDWGASLPTLTPDGMTRAALETCVGAAFFPGIEATTTIRTFAYDEPFRLRHAPSPNGLKPGDVTKLMARPWQGDFAWCAGGNSFGASSWWPAARPISVFPEATPTTKQFWTRDIAQTAEDMVDNWFRLGFIVDPGSGSLVETERHVVCKDCFIITDRSTFGKDEIEAMLLQSQPNPAVIDAAFYVVVEGFTPAELGITTATPTDAQLQAFAPAIAIAPAVAGMSTHASALKTENPALPNQPQRFTFVYQVRFTNSSGFTAEVLPVMLTATKATVSSSAMITLITQPNPFVIDGAVSWLSTDLRVFQVPPNGSLQGLPAVTMGSTPAAASTFIKAVIDAFNGSSAPTHPFDLILTDQQTSRLELAEKVNNTPVFNFAVCRVRYRALSVPANNVRVFFRLFQTAATGTNYDPGTTYRRGGQPGVTIPLLGIQGGELVTIPCFAEPRVGAATPLTQQTDPKNVQPILPDATGAERDAYFGCWLDINQPQLLFPIQPSPSDGGPFSGTLKSIQQLIRGYHQCLVAEVAFDSDPIPAGVSPAASDKLAQRNLAIVESANPGDVASHRIQHTFDIKPTRATLERGEKADELMVDWGNTPIGSLATFYMPGLQAADVLKMAGRMYETTTLERVDDHTLQCRTGGVVYIPVPSGAAAGFAALLTVDLPATVRRDQTFRIVVRQFTTGHAAQRLSLLREAASREGIAAATKASGLSNARRVLGAFQITVPVTVKEAMLAHEQRALAVLRFILEAIPPENRWFLVFQRYVGQIADRVGALGGDPRTVIASSSGEVKDAAVQTCAWLSWTTAALLCALIVVLGVLQGGALTVVATILAILLVLVGGWWAWRCRPTLCRLLRVFIAGDGVAAALLAIIALLGAVTPQLVSVLGVSVVLAVIAAIWGKLRGCF